MTYPPLRIFCLMPLALAFALSPFPANADIIGFGDFSDFTINQSDGAAPPVTMPGEIRLTGQSSFTQGESRSVFFNVPQDISEFRASFVYRAEQMPSMTRPYGATFVMHNSSGGLQTVAEHVHLGVRTRLGYDDEPGRFQESVAVSLERGSLASGSSSTNVYWDGNARGGGSIATGAVDLFSGNPIQVTLTYDGAVLHQTLLDTVTLDSFQTNFDVDIPLLAGGTTAFVGFTAANNSNASMPGVNQYISDFHFEGAAVPEPSSVLLLLIGVGVTCGIRRWGNKRRSDA